MNMIERDIYVLADRTPVSIPIDYVQGSNLIPIKFNIVDYDPPTGATAKVYVKKPSTKAEYDTATIDGNSVIIDVKDSMFTEKDTHFIQVLINKDDKNLVTFEYPVRVGRNNVAGELPESENRSNFLDDYLGRIDQRIDDTETRLGQSLVEVVAAKNTAIENANIAINKAEETEADRQETEQNAAVAKSYAEQARKLVESVPSWAKQPAPDKTLTQEGQAADAKAVGDVREQVSEIKSDLFDLQKSVGITYSPALEKGNAYFSTGEPFFSQSDSRVRTVQGTTIRLKKGAIIKLNSYYLHRYYISWKKSDNTWDSLGWLREDYVCTEDGEYVILITKVPESIISDYEVSEISKMLVIGYTDGLLNSVLTKDEIKKFGSSIDIWHKMYNLSIGSSKNTYVPSDTRLSIAEVLCFDSEIDISADSGYRFAVHLRNDDGSFELDTGWMTFYQIPKNKKFTATFSRIDDKPISVADRVHYVFNDDRSDFIISVYEKTRYSNGFVKGIAHRGMNVVAPENTIPSYQKAKECGYKYVECDVSFTSDNVPVLLHDETIDRTSNGSGAISKLSLAQVKTYDFGSWKDESFSGTRIPTLEEFIIFCKNNSLHPYIEIKGGTTTEQVAIAVKVVAKCGMLRNCTWIAFNPDYLQSVRAIDARSRLGLVCDTATNYVLNNAVLLNKDSECFIDISERALTDEFIEQCSVYGLSIEIWTVDDINQVIDCKKCVSGITSNRFNADELISYVNEIGSENLKV